MTVYRGLRPCPFCGTTGNRKFFTDDEKRTEMYCLRVHQDKDGWGAWWVECSCTAVGPIGETRDEAIKNWNARKG